MLEHFKDQISTLRLDRVYYAVIQDDKSLSFNTILVDTLRVKDSMDPALVFSRLEGTVPLFEFNEAMGY
jgi:hypothetical protein